MPGGDTQTVDLDIPGSWLKTEQAAGGRKGKVCTCRMERRCSCAAAGMPPPQRSRMAVHARCISTTVRQWQRSSAAVDRGSPRGAVVAGACRRSGESPDSDLHPAPPGQSKFPGCWLYGIYMVQDLGFLETVAFMEEAKQTAVPCKQSRSQRAGVCGSVAEKI